MYIVSVIIHVLPEKVDDFLRASEANARGTRQEVGNLRYDIGAAEDTPSTFMFYEVYRSKADFIAHQQTPHYLLWRSTVAEWMAQPRQGSRYLSRFPDEREQAWRSG